MRSTPRTVVTSRRTRNSAVLVALAALVAAGVQTSSAGATSTAAEHPAASAAALSTNQRAALIAAAQSGSTDTARSLGLGAKEKLVVRDVVRDADGTVHTRYDRTYDGLPVLGGDLVVHVKGKHKSVTSATSKKIAVPTTTPKVPAATAQRSALRVASDVKSAKADPDASRKVIWAASGTPVLAWESIVRGVQKDGTPSQLHIISDATTGKKLYSFDGIETGTGTGQYNGKVTIGTTRSGSSYQMVDNTRGGHRTTDLKQGTSGSGTLFTNSTDTWGNGSQSNRQTAGVDAHYGAQETWDFYKQTFGRSGIRNDGVASSSRVHYGNGYVNAFWDDSCFCMTYGDGQGNANPLTALDVAGHEMSHGVTSATAGLEYAGESGGLNEATSDIMGTGVEFFANNPKVPANYLIGEQININGDGTPLRYMDQPSKDGASLDYWSPDAGNVDVHYSSGIANHFFYLLSEGSGSKTINGFTYNSPTYDGSTLSGIGRGKALAIWYKALTTYMTSTTDYAAARQATLSAAADLYGSGGAEYQAVAATWTAVNVN
ncbi:M4 family metallopeptidase [Streptomyces sp. UNOC14_S4]|uniref:M4 family metallopeptidase n=1 Tax=Streptomyces sp. UNOC14_S4 TaxID=2872340 RepID=UPI001E30CD9B|nr:M4 family metallopeptidase [Streptomyces sp. UNOC14_S4]MCC3771093.1 M4 family metallopeptidase [Streptomyces sp. UNOC14_S4]